MTITTALLQTILSPVPRGVIASLCVFIKPAQYTTLQPVALLAWPCRMIQCKWRWWTVLSHFQLLWLCSSSCRKLVASPFFHRCKGYSILLRSHVVAVDPQHHEGMFVDVTWLPESAERRCIKTSLKFLTRFIISFTFFYKTGLLSGGKKWTFPQTKNLLAPVERFFIFLMKT